VGAFKQLVIALRLTHLRGNWEEQVNAYITNDERKRKMISENTSDLFNEKCKTILAYLPLLISRLKMVSQRQTAEQFRIQYLQLLDDLGMLTWYKRDAAFLSQTEREKEFRAFNKFIKLFDQLLWTIRFIHGEKSFNLSDYYQYLMLITSDITYNLREWSNYGVQILPRLEIQSAELNILIMGGLVEGKFPRNFTRDIFFNDTERQMMGLNATEDLLAQDRFLFYQLLSLPIQKIILSHPDYEQDAKLLPSTFISNLKDVAEVNIVQSDIDKSYLLSRHNLLQYIAEGLQDPLSETNLDIFENALQLYERNITKFWLKGIDILYAKLSRKQITNYEGYLSANEKIREIMHAKSLKPISVTALESYAFCPMQFFLQRIMKLEEEEEVEITVTALEKGLLIHKILFRFYTHLKEKNKQSRPWLYKKQLHKIANEEFAKMPYQGMFWILENESVFGSQDRPGLWDAFIDLEQEEITRTGFEPRYFEVSFGRTGDQREQDEVSKPMPLRIENSGRKVDLIGKIDRIDMDAQGNLMVIDYKISSNIEGMTFKQVFEGSSLQLPLYLQMIYSHLKQLGVKASPQAGMYYQVRDAENCKRRIVFSNIDKRSELLLRGSGRLPNKIIIIDGEPLTLQKMIDRSLKFVFDYVDSLSNGIFTHTDDPKNQRCEKYCSYSKICRKDISKMLALKKDDVH
jgi:ATP-dependent helicase/DNAse subunit B